MAHLKDKPATTSSFTSSSISASSSVKMVTQRLLGSSNGVRNLAFGSGNTANKAPGGSSKFTATTNVGPGASNGPAVPSYDGEGTYMIFNVGDTLFISDYTSHDKVSLAENNAAHVMIVNVSLIIVCLFCRSCRTQ